MIIDLGWSEFTAAFLSLFIYGHDDERLELILFVLPI